MTYINYCVNLTEKEKLEIDKQVRKNRFELRFAILLVYFLNIQTKRDKLLDDLIEKGQSIDIENYDLIDFNIDNL